MRVSQNGYSSGKVESRRNLVIYFFDIIKFSHIISLLVMLSLFYVFGFVLPYFAAASLISFGMFQF